MIRTLLIVVIAACTVSALPTSCLQIPNMHKARCSCNKSDYLFREELYFKCPAVEIQLYIEEKQAIVTCSKDQKQVLEIPILNISELKRLQLVDCLSTGLTVRELIEGLKILRVKTVEFTSEEVPVKTLKKNTLSSLTNVSEITLSDLGLSVVNSEVFGPFWSTLNHSFSWQLHSLSLANNTIEELDEMVFATLTSIKELFLDGNNLTSLHSDLFWRNTELETLTLNNNRLTQIPSGLFNNTRRLRVLNLSNNRLTQIPSGLFNNTRRLRILNLSNNWLTQIPSGLFNNMMRLRILNLSSNWLGRIGSTLPPDLFRPTPLLEELNLDHNQLTHLPSGLFDNMAALRTLYLNSNSIGVNDSNIPAGLLRYATALQYLHLENNCISRLPPDLFANNTRLRMVFLAYNPLTHIHSDLFAPLVKLERLVLSHSRITQLWPEGPVTLPSLTWLDVSHNPLGSLSLVEGGESVLRKCRRLTVLLLRNTSLSTIYPDWRRLGQLIRLDLTNNRFTSIKLSDLTFSSEVSVDLGHNHIESVDISAGKVTYYPPRPPGGLWSRPRLAKNPPGSMGWRWGSYYPPQATDYHPYLPTLETQSPRVKSSTMRYYVTPTPRPKHPRELYTLCHVSLQANPFRCDCALNPFVNHVMTNDTLAIEKTEVEFVDRDKMSCYSPVGMVGRCLSGGDARATACPQQQAISPTKLSTRRRMTELTNKVNFLVSLYTNNTI